MSRVIAAYDLDEDHGRLWVNADLKRMPEVVIVANQLMDRAQTVTYVPETRLLEAMDAAREAGRREDMAERVAADRKGLCDSLKETNDDLRRIVDELRETERPADENAKLRTFIDLKETCWKYVGWCDECPYNGVDDEHDDCNCTVREKVSSLARELGIEVTA